MSEPPPRIILLTTAHTYRAPAFQAAAEKLGVEVVEAVDTPQELGIRAGRRLSIPFRDLAQATQEIVAYARETPVAAIIPVDDSGTQLAAEASAALGLAHNDPRAALAARDKTLMRRLLRDAGVRVPAFRVVSLAADPAALATEIVYPCVLKPPRLSGSRGVLRADDAASFAAAFDRVARIQRRADPHGPSILLVEEYIPGVEVAVEGLLEDGWFHVLALFDKPDPLEGPTFEETIYVTPSRLTDHQQAVIVAQAAAAAEALGLRWGPAHAELRLNDRGAWVVEIAGRSIGGLCGQVLRFGEDQALEELILRVTCGLPLTSLDREATPRGVMMIPIPGPGILRSVAGVADAEAIPGVDGVTITAPVNNPLVPLPEGESYLGFIFARGPTPAAVEASLREAHACLSFSLDPLIALEAS